MIAREIGIDNTILQHEIGGHDAVTEVLDTKGQNRKQFGRDG